MEKLDREALIPTLAGVPPLKEICRRKTRRVLWADTLRKGGIFAGSRHSDLYRQCALSKRHHSAIALLRRPTSSECRYLCDCSRDAQRFVRVAISSSASPAHLRNGYGLTPARWRQG